MDHPYALVVVVIATPMVSLHVSLHRDVLGTLDLFTFQWIVDEAIVVGVVIVGD